MSAEQMCARALALFEEYLNVDCGPVTSNADRMFRIEQKMKLEGQIKNTLQAALRDDAREGGG